MLKELEERVGGEELPRERRVHVPVLLLARQGDGPVAPVDVPKGRVQVVEVNVPKGGRRRSHVGSFVRFVEKPVFVAP